MSHYNGVDWIAMCLTFSAIYLLGNKSRIGFVVMMLGNLVCCIIGLQAESYAMIIANLGFFPMNIRGFIKLHRSNLSYAVCCSPVSSDTSDEWRYCCWSLRLPCSPLGGVG